MKSLHLCNIANVAYGYCKILRQASSHCADLRCHDLTHLMSQPEWDDLELDSKDFSNENNFEANTADLGGYRRPHWFQTPPIYPALPAGRAPVRAVFGARVAESYRRFLHRVGALAQATKSRMPARLKRRLRGPYQRVSLMGRALLSGRPRQHFAETQATLQRIEERLVELSKASRRYAHEWHLTPDMLRRYLPHACWLERHLGGHDVVMAYVFTPIYALLQGQAPFVSVEIGTMRDLPFDGTANGKMLALAYRLSDHVLITNPDVVVQARRLGLERYTFCPHPVDEDLFRPAAGAFPLRAELLRQHNADFLLFAPARQNWEVKGNDRYLRAFRSLLTRGARAALIIPGWGQEVDRSKQLCAELGLGARVCWISPLSEKIMIKYYQAADIVLDQFQLRTFGLITAKAMSCGCPVMTCYDPAIHDWCFDEHPPIVNCRTAEEIAAALELLWRSPSQGKQIGRASRQWIQRHHSKQVVQTILTRVMRSAVVHFWRTRHRQ